MKIILIISAALVVAHYGYSRHQFESVGNFDGPYVGLNMGSQNVFGGSFVNNMDILAQESKFVTEILLGFRKQFLNDRLVAGLEFSVGFLNGNLEHVDTGAPLRISYKNSSQISFGLQSGILLGNKRRCLLFGYLHETKRNFDVTIDQPPYLYTQNDKQGMLKYGVGLECQLTKHFHIETTFGSLLVDFGDVETNINVEDKYDITLGFIYQF